MTSKIPFRLELIPEMLPILNGGAAGPESDPGEPGPWTYNGEVWEYNDEAWTYNDDPALY